MKKALAAVGILVLCLLAFLWFRETKLFAIEMDGFMYPSNDIITNLMVGGKDAKNFDAIAVSDGDEVFLQHNDYFVDNGENRKQVTISLPTTSTDGARIMVLNGGGAFTSKYVLNTTFYGAVIADGTMYNMADNEQVDREKYIFLKTDELFMNVFKIELAKDGKKSEVPANSLVYFERNSLRYYALNNEKTKYVYHEITGIDLKNDVTIDEDKISYGELLKRLGVWRGDEEENNGPEEIIPEEEEKKAPSGEGSGGHVEEKDKMEVSAKFVSADTYAATFMFNIHDPNGEIVRFPTVEIFEGGKTYARKTFYSSSDASEIIGLKPETRYTYKIYYTYRNEEDKLFQGTLDEGEFTTLNMDGIEAIELSYGDVTARANDATISDLKFNNGINDRVLKGLSKFIIMIDGQEVKFGSSAISTLKTGGYINYTTPGILKSNTVYHFEFRAYDVAGNRLNVTNSGVDLKTVKVPPTAKLSVRDSDFTWFRAEASIDNPDNVHMENLRYVLLDGDRILREGSLPNDKIIYESNLSDNKVYQLLLYADYDLNDGNGNQRNKVLADTYVATTSIAMLGNLRLMLNKIDVTKESASFDMAINTRTTDHRLIELLNQVVIYVEDENGETVVRKEIDELEMQTLKAGNVIDLLFNDLDSNTEYKMRGEAKFNQGDVEYNVEVVLGMRSFRTMKKPAVVEIIDDFKTSSMIDYTVRVVDPDGSITSDRVIMRVERVNGNILGVEDLEINGDYKRFNYNKLDNNTLFEATFTAEGYNEGFTDATAVSGKVLLVKKFVTSDGVDGSISLESLLRQRTGKNHYEIKNLQRWKDVSLGGSDTSTTTDRSYDLENDVTYLSVKNGWRYYSYFLPELIGKQVTVSFDAKIETAGSAEFLARVANNDSAITSCTLSGLNNKYQHYKCTFTVGAKGYVGFYLQEVSAQNRLAQIAIRKLQIEEGNTETSYEPYQGKTTYLATTRTSLVDINHETTNNDYYIKVYRFGELVQEIRCPLNDEGVAEDVFTDFDVEMNSNYSVWLAVRINDVDYNIASTEFTTEAEIRSIRNLDEFKNMHIAGKYYVINDIDFRGQGTLYKNFYGIIDFQGNRIDYDNKASVLFGNFYGTLKNVDYHMHLTAPSSSIVRWRWGLADSNYGMMQNVFVTIDESIPGSAYYSISTMARYNYGTIDTFVIHMKASMYGIHSLSPFVLQNYGTIRNGYAYADEGVKIVTYYNRAAESNPKYVGVFAARQMSTGRLENVYSLVDVDSSAVIIDDHGTEGRLEYVANLVGAADAGATMSHVYSNADGEKRNLAIDINWYPTKTYDPTNPTNFNVDKMYYVLSEKRVLAGEDYARQGSTRISPWTLRDISFQNDTLNSYSAFDVDSFVKYGYYPHIIFPEVMPNQDYISLPVMDDKDLPDVVNVISIQQDDNSSATVTFNVRNYYQRDIINMEIDKLTTEIIEQTHKDRYTKLVVKVSNPTQYLSVYSIKSINNGRLRTYGANERIVNVEMYREISTVQDWQKIKTYPNENHRLVNDIDFNGVAPATFRITGNFKGKLDGGGYTVSNMVVDNGNAAVENLFGTIMNLFIDNYAKRTTNAYGGFISTVQQGGRVVNVHMKNVEVLGTTYVGGLVGNMNGGVIQNSSVSGVKLYNITASSAQTLVGGLAGRIANSSIIQNSYVAGIDFDIRQAPNVYAIGGLVGQVSSGTLDNVYTEGKIQTKTPSNGGIIGQAQNYGNLTHGYSCVDIFSSSNIDIGGIIGEVTNPSHFVVSNTLSVGAIYSSLSGGTVRRVLGGDIVINLPNFAWHDQHINGLITEETSGETLLSTEELNVVDNYTRVMEMGDAFSYDGIGDNSLPLLYAIDSTDLLPNQEKLYLKKYDFEIGYIEVQPGVNPQGKDNAWIYMEILNPDGVEITDITIDDVVVKQVTQNRNQGNTTFYRMEIEPIYYYDSYRLSGITYKSGEETKTASKDTKVEMQFFRDIWTVADWQNINPISSENYRLRANIDFTGVDINHNLYINRLDGFENGFTLSNITLNGNGSNVGLLHVVNSSLYNITFEHINITNTGASVNNTGLVLFGYGRAEKLVFDDINVTATKSDYVGIIADNYESDMRDITIKNSKFSGKSHVGGYAGRTKPFSVTGVNIEDVTVTGTSTYVGGFAGEQLTAYVLVQYGIVAKHVNVSGTDYVGGIYGKGAGNNLRVTSNDNGDKSIVSGTKRSGNSYVGGISGHVIMSVATMTNSSIDSTTISATGQYLGGIAGYADRNITVSTVKNVTIDGKNTATRVGGIAGATNGSYSISTAVVGGDAATDKVVIKDTGNGAGGICGGYCTVSSSVVNNIEINTTGTYVGGINGYSYTTTSSLVRNSKITGGTYVGGIAGVINGYNLHTNVVVNTEVKGTSQVGGLLGGSASSSGNNTNYYNNTINATKIEATGDDAGGLIGYLNNKESSTTIQTTTTYYYRRYVYNNIVENADVVANNNASGLIGRIEVSTEFDGLQPDRIYGNVIAASSVATTNASKDPGVIFGNDDKLAYSGSELRATKTKVYENMKMIKGTETPVIVKNYTGNNFDVFSDRASKMATLDNLKTQTFYTGLGHATSVYIYGQLSNSKFPYIKAVDNLANVSTDQILVALPSAVTTNSLSPTSFGAGRMMTRGFSYHAMPEYTIYAVNANTINVEFSSLDEQTTFKINGVEYPIDNRVFSFNYNFDTDIEFEMTDGTSTKTKTYKPEDLRGSLATVGDNYYILNNGRVISNNHEYELGALNIMGNEILTDDGRIIDLMTDEVKDVEDLTVEWIGAALPIYEYDSNGSNIKVYANYSVVDDTTEKEKQVLVKGAQTEIINPSIKNVKHKLIMDSYNNKDYLTVLGVDNTLYDLKTALIYPDNFSKEGIVDISSNFRDFSHLLAVRYENGKVVVFDYRTGNVVYKIQPEEVPSPLEYFVQQVTTNNEKMYNEESLENNLQTAENMKSTIASGSVVSPKNNISANGNYVTSYDPVKDEYEIYETGELLKQDPLGAATLSVSDKIYGDNVLNTLFGGMLSHDRNDNVAIVAIYVGIGATIVISMVALGDLLRKKV